MPHKEAPGRETPLVIWMETFALVKLRSTIWTCGISLKRNQTARSSGGNGWLLSGLCCLLFLMFQRHVVALRARTLCISEAISLTQSCESARRRFNRIKRRRTVHCDTSDSILLFTALAVCVRNRSFRACGSEPARRTYSSGGDYLGHTFFANIYTAQRPMPPTTPAVRQTLIMSVWDAAHMCCTQWTCLYVCAHAFVRGPAALNASETGLQSARVWCEESCANFTLAVFTHLIRTAL